MRVLRWLHDVVNNWGVAIILLTLFVRTLLWPVQAKANSAMKLSQLVSPNSKELQEKYKDQPDADQSGDDQALPQIRRQSIDCCFPYSMRVTIFFGFYRVLWYAAELRGQRLIWVHGSLHAGHGRAFGGLASLVNPLPLVMALSSFLQMRLTPQPPNADKTQANIIKFMPLMFLFFCYNFASALALYWTTQNIFSIFQAQIQRRFQQDPVLKKKGDR